MQAADILILLSSSLPRLIICREGQIVYISDQKANNFITHLNDTRKSHTLLTIRNEYLVIGYVQSVTVTVYTGDSCL
jgi:hypothetical protein